MLKNEKYSYRKIVNFPGVHHTTISREIKLHVKLNHSGYLPEIVKVTNAETHENRYAYNYNIEEGDVVAFNRGFNDYEYYASHCVIKSYFVTKLRKNAKYIVLKERDISKYKYIKSDKIIISIYNSLAKFKFKSSFKTYCYRIARNNAIDILRKNSKYKKIVNAAAEYTTQKELSKNEIEQKLLFKEDVLELLLKLNNKEKELILLKDIEGLSIKEIKQIVKLPEGTIKSRLHRAREKLITLYKI